MDGYVNLLSECNAGAYWDESQFDNPQEEQVPPTVEAPPSVRQTGKRSKNFSVAEDNMLCSAWLGVSMDAVQGNEQSSQTYWHRIHTFFHENKEFESDRGDKSLCNRWHAIRDSVGKFCGYYEHILNRRQSGMTMDDRIMQALEMYKAIKKKTFPFSHCWHILRGEQKWIDRMPQKKQKITLHSSPRANSSDDGWTDPTPESEHVARPLGRKAEKERQGKGKSTSSPNNNMFVDALENLWAKRLEIDTSKEHSRKERSD